MSLNCFFFSRIGTTAFGFMLVLPTYFVLLLPMLDAILWQIYKKIILVTLLNMFLVKETAKVFLVFNKLSFFPHVVLLINKDKR